MYGDVDVFGFPGRGWDEHRDSRVQFELPYPAELVFPKPETEPAFFLRLENILLSTLMAAFHVSKLRIEVSRQSGAIFSPAKVRCSKTAYSRGGETFQLDFMSRRDWVSSEDFLQNTNPSRASRNLGQLEQDPWGESELEDSNVEPKFCFKPHQNLAPARAAAEHPSRPKISGMHGRRYPPFWVTG